MAIAQPTREIPWANTTASPDIAEPSDGQKLAGWPGTPAPRYDWFNWILRQAARWVCYLRARGIPDYDAAESYTIGDRVQYDGDTFRCIQAGVGVATSNAAYWEPWGYSESGLDDTLGAKSPSPVSAITVQPTSGGTATVASCCMFTIPGHGHGTGYKVLAIEITDMITTGAYFDITIGSAAAFTYAVVQVTPTGDVDPANGVTVVERQSAGTWRVYVQTNYNNGDHPGFNVTFTGYNNAE
jgi:hypothetical protein